MAVSVGTVLPQRCAGGGCNPNTIDNIPDTRQRLKQCALKGL
jgi:hypothetical protein